MMEYALGHLLVAMYSLLATVKLSSAVCRLPSSCYRIRGTTLKVLTNEGNKTAVCSTLPLFIHCVEAYTKCQQNDDSFPERNNSSVRNTSYLPMSVGDARKKHKEMCLPHDDTSANEGNKANKLSWVTSPFVFLLLNAVTVFMNKFLTIL